MYALQIKNKFAACLESQNKLKLTFSPRNSGQENLIYLENQTFAYEQKLLSTGLFQNVLRRNSFTEAKFYVKITDP